MKYGNVEFLTDHWGVAKPIYIEQKPQDPKGIVELQSRLNSASVFLKGPIPKEQLHLPWLDLNRPHLLWRELAKMNPDLDFNTFMNLYGEFLFRVRQIDQYPISLEAEKLNTYGGRRPQVGLEMRPDQTFTESRRVVCGRVVEFIQGFGVADIGIFLDKNFSKQFDTGFTLHIPLGLVSNTSLSKIDVLGMKISLTPPTFENIVFLH